ncbi:MAG: hypothetical protein HY017_02465 [Betaproteobacteria bacterium]|nr:hypothetical protein [Betaproteobacteria bacterium]
MRVDPPGDGYPVVRIVSPPGTACHGQVHEAAQGTADTAKVHEYFDSGAHVGKIVLVP